MQGEQRWTVPQRGEQMEVVCRGCGKKVDRDRAYKITQSKTNLYYCSEDEYKKVLAEKEKAQDIRNELQAVIDDIFGYPVTNTALYKEQSEWSKIKSLDNVVAYLYDNKQYISTTLKNKSFNSEYGKIRYFSAIIKNSIQSYVPPSPEIIKRADVEIYDAKYKPGRKRKCLADYEDGD